MEAPGLKYWQEPHWYYITVSRFLLWSEQQNSKVLLHIIWQMDCILHQAVQQTGIPLQMNATLSTYILSTSNHLTSSKYVHSNIFVSQYTSLSGHTHPKIFPHHSLQISNSIRTERPLVSQWHLQAEDLPPIEIAEGVPKAPLTVREKSMKWNMPSQENDIEWPWMTRVD
jgi:hypothetical protein